MSHFIYFLPYTCWNDLEQWLWYKLFVSVLVWIQTKIVVSICAQVFGWPWCSIHLQKGPGFQASPTAVSIRSEWYSDGATPYSNDSESQSAFISPKTRERAGWDVWIVAFVCAFAPFTVVAMVQDALWHIWGVQDLYIRHCKYTSGFCDVPIVFYISTPAFVSVCMWT